MSRDEERVTFALRRWDAAHVVVTLSAEADRCGQEKMHARAAMLHEVIAAMWRAMGNEVSAAHHLEFAGHQSNKWHEARAAEDAAASKMPQHIGAAVRAIAMRARHADDDDQPMHGR